MSTIGRDPAAAHGKRFDVVVVGGGVYGAMVLMQAAARGLTALLLEQADFGSATSFNSLRMMHGGLRFLQSLDIPRSRQMIAARAWLLNHFPDLVVPISCLMPLYNQGLRRTHTLGPALRVDNLLGRQANDRLAPQRRIAAGRLVAAERVRQLFPQVRTAGLKGGAIWQDGQLTESPRLIVEALRWATSMGASALNYVAATEVLCRSGRVCGVRAVDQTNDDAFEIEAEVVINAAGPNCRALANLWDRDIPRLFEPSLAWNVLFDRPQLSDHALAVSDPQRGQVFFLVPWKGKILAGTGHAPAVDPSNARVDTRHLDAMIAEINACIPGLGLDLSEVAHVFSGLLPVRAPGSTQLATREVIYDHGKRGGPQGLFSISGVKLVAAPSVAAKAIDQVSERFFPGRPTPAQLPPRPRATSGWDVDPRQPIDTDTLARIAAEESVVHLSDLVLRRTSLWQGQRPVEDLAALVAPVLGCQDPELAAETALLRSELQGWDRGHT